MESTRKERERHAEPLSLDFSGKWELTLKIQTNPPHTSERSRADWLMLTARDPSARRCNFAFCVQWVPCERDLQRQCNRKKNQKRRMGYCPKVKQPASLEARVKAIKFSHSFHCVLTRSQPWDSPQPKSESREHTHIYAFSFSKEGWGLAGRHDCCLTPVPRGASLPGAVAFLLSRFSLNAQSQQTFPEPLD